MGINYDYVKVDDRTFLFGLSNLQYWLKLYNRYRKNYLNQLDPHILDMYTTTLFTSDYCFSVSFFFWTFSVMFWNSNINAIQRITNLDTWVLLVFLLFHKWLFVVHAYVTQNRGADKKKTFRIELSICNINLLPKKRFSRYVSLLTYQETKVNNVPT